MSLSIILIVACLLAFLLTVAGGVLAFTDKKYRVAGLSMAGLGLLVILGAVGIFVAAISAMG